jgi:hypothetical protein
MIEGLRSRIELPATGSNRSVSLPSRRLGGSAIDLRDGREVRFVLEVDERSAFRDRH